MQKMNTVTVGTFINVEAGDLIATEHIAAIVSGKVVAVVRWGFQLTDEQRSYMREHNLDIPKDQYQTLGSETSALYFGDFYSPGVHYEHMYIDDYVAVAIFPNPKGE
jgi:hypothetical protein